MNCLDLLDLFQYNIVLCIFSKCNTEGLTECPPPPPPPRLICKVGLLNLLRDVLVCLMPSVAAGKQMSGRVRARVRVFVCVCVCVCVPLLTHKSTPGLTKRTHCTKCVKYMQICINKPGFHESTICMKYVPIGINKAGKVSK